MTINNIINSDSLQQALLTVCQQISDEELSILQQGGQGGTSLITRIIIESTTIAGNILRGYTNRNIQQNAEVIRTKFKKQIQVVH